MLTVFPPTLKVSKAILAIVSVVMMVWAAATQLSLLVAEVFSNSLSKEYFTFIIGNFSPITPVEENKMSLVEIFLFLEIK